MKPRLFLITVLLTGILLFIGCHSANVKKYGGTPRKKPAAEKGLCWLKENQNRDGSWGTEEASKQLTPLVILALCERGVNPSSQQLGQTSHKALRWVQKEASENKTPSPLITYAIASSYNLTQIPSFKALTSKQTDLILDSQQKDGSFKYYGDSLISANKYNAFLHCLNLLALKEGYMSRDWSAKDDESIDKAFAWLFKNCYLKEKHCFSLYPGDKTNSDLATAIALYTIEALFQNVRGVRISLEKMNSTIKFNWKRPELDHPFLTWYSLTKANFYGLGGRGKVWSNWYRQYYNELIKHQNEAGYWFHPDTGAFFDDKKDRTIYCTAMAILMLEVYYIYVPSHTTNGLKLDKKILNEFNGPEETEEKPDPGLELDD